MRADLWTMRNVANIQCCQYQFPEVMDLFSHSTDGAGNSFTLRIKVKGKAELADIWSDVPDGDDPSFRFLTVEVALPW